MGDAKSWEHRQKTKVAGHVAVDAGALQACPLHPASLFKGNASLAVAQDLARERHERGTLYGSYDSIQELLGYLRRVVADNPRSGCEICALIEREKLSSDAMHRELAPSKRPCL